MFRFVIFVLLFSFSLMNGFASDVTTSLSHTTVGINDSFSLTFSLKDGQGAKPDFSPLLEDFDILSNNQEQSMSIINGKMNQERRWKLTLIAKEEGLLTIPSIQFGSSSSQPLVINVTTSSGAKSQEIMFIETELNPPKSLFEQTQLIYTIRIYTAQQIAQGALSNIKTSDSDAIIEKLGDDLQYEHFHQNGRRYLVIERQYAIFPQHAGELTIYPITFEGNIVSQGHSFFDMQTQFKRLVSNAMNIEVKPIPAPFTKDNWFAAYGFKWAETWSANPDKMTLGEPLTWTLNFQADGCLGNQIPTPSLDFPGEFKHYSDKIETKEEISDDGFIGFKQMKIALIATKSGKFIIPKVSLQWWNLNTNQINQLEIPERIFEVEGGPIAMDEVPSSLEQPPVEPLQDNIENNQTSSFDRWNEFGIATIAILILSLFAFQKLRSNQFRRQSLNSAKSNIKKACSANDPKQAEASLLAWGLLVFPHLKPLNMTKLKQQLPADCQTVIDELYFALYGKNQKWDGDQLWRVFASYKPSKKEQIQSKQKELKELYPTE